MGQERGFVPRMRTFLVVKGFTLKFPNQDWLSTAEELVSLVKLLPCRLNHYMYVAQGPVNHGIKKELSWATSWQVGIRRW